MDRGSSSYGLLRPLILSLLMLFSAFSPFILSLKSSEAGEFEHDDNRPFWTANQSLTNNSMYMIEEVAWADSIGSRSKDYITGMQVDSNGKVYTNNEFCGRHGSSSCPITVGDFSSSLSYGHSGSEFAVARSDGTWETYQHFSRAPIIDMVNDSSGNIYLLGSTSGYSASFYGTTISKNSNFLAKINHLNQKVWLNTWSYSGSGNSLNIEIYGDDIYLCTAIGTNTVSISGKSVSTNLTSSTAFAVFKLSTSTGNGEWAKAAGSTGGSSGEINCNDISATPDGAIVAGNYNGSAYFDSISLNNNYSRERGFVAKISSDGDWEWAKQPASKGFKSGNKESDFLNIEATGNDSAVIIGDTNYDLDFNVSTFSSNHANFIVSIDEDQTWKWVRSVRGSMITISDMDVDVN